MILRGTDSKSCSFMRKKCRLEAELAGMSASLHQCERSLLAGDGRRAGIFQGSLPLSSTDPFVGEPQDQATNTRMAGISLGQRNVHGGVSRDRTKASTLD